MIGMLNIGNENMVDFYASPSKAVLFRQRSKSMVEYTVDGRSFINGKPLHEHTSQEMWNNNTDAGDSGCHKDCSNNIEKQTEEKWRFILTRAYDEWRRKLNAIKNLRDNSLDAINLNRVRSASCITCVYCK
ncbi:unnamed protein product [Dracunculus medinensis]|uniref:Effector protein n=1 Tax=Dracunculus medinensis TaxID=318479 RepID=A0A0N4UJ19_DRAME|nr:unnamed protein product [Dracunculus medinensis]